MVQKLLLFIYGVTALVCRFGNYLTKNKLQISGPMVKWLRHSPFTAVSRVRVSVGSPRQFGGIKFQHKHFSFIGEIRRNLGAFSLHKKEKHKSVNMDLQVKLPPAA